MEGTIAAATAVATAVASAASTAAAAIVSSGKLPSLVIVFFDRGDSTRTTLYLVSPAAMTADRISILTSAQTGQNHYNLYAEGMFGKNFPQCVYEKGEFHGPDALIAMDCERHSFLPSEFKEWYPTREGGICGSGLDRYERVFIFDTWSSGQ